MRHAIILVRLHGEEEFRVHSGREVPIQDQIRTFKGLLGSRTHPEIAEVEIWYSDGSPRRSAKFSLPAPGTASETTEEGSGEKDEEDSSDSGAGEDSESRAASNRKSKNKAAK